MVEVAYEVLDGAKLVKTKEIAGREFLQVWHGGIGVNVYGASMMRGGKLKELDYWTAQRHDGKAYDRGVIDEMMEQHFVQMIQEY